MRGTWAMPLRLVGVRDQAGVLKSDKDTDGAKGLSYCAQPVFVLSSAVIAQRTLVMVEVVSGGYQRKRPVVVHRKLCLFASVHGVPQPCHCYRPPTLLIPSRPAVRVFLFPSFKTA